MNIALKTRDYTHAQLPEYTNSVSPESSLTSLLRAFQCHSLDDQSRAALMDRVDTKFILPMKSLPEFLTSLKDEYSILEQSGRRLFTYDTRYFDTPDRFFYRSHHNGKLNRNKVRFRHYTDTNTAFMEVKLKNNKERTIKQRVPLDPTNPDFSSTKQFLNQCLNERINNLETALVVKYQRITLMNKFSPERLTMDLFLSFKSSANDSQVNLPQIWVAELKRDRKASNSSFIKLIKQQRISSVNFSKYCIGSVLTGNGALKANRFKPTLRQLARLTNIENIIQL